MRTSDTYVFQNKSQFTLMLLFLDLESICYIHSWVTHITFRKHNDQKQSSSSSIGCGAGNHKVSPCTTIISKCGNLLFLHCSFIIPKQSLYIIKVWSTWSTRSPSANGWNVQSISSSRPGGFTLHMTGYAPACTKSVEKGSFLDIRRRRRLLQKGYIFRC